MVNKKIKDLVQLLLNENDSRENISNMASELIKDIENNNVDIESNIFSFLLYLQGFDMPDTEKEYLFSKDDLKFEFEKIKNKL